jgi:hypothetical protein
VLNGVNGDAVWAEGGRGVDVGAAREHVGQDGAVDVAEDAVGGVEEA